MSFDITASCLMLQVPKDLSGKISEWAAANVKPEHLYNKEGKGMQRGHHITLAPQINDESAHSHIIDVMKNTQAMSVGLGNVGLFMDPQKGYHVLKIAVDPEKLAPVRERVIQGVEMYNPTYEFNPHITIAYVKPGTCHNLVDDETFKGMACDINSCIYSAVDGGDKFVNLQPAPGPVKVESASIDALREMIITKLSSIIA